MDKQGGGDDNNGALRGPVRHVWKTLRARARLRRQQAAHARSTRLRYVTPEQLAYADVLEVGLSMGRALLAGTFILYVFGIVTPKVPLSELTANWSLPAGEYSSRNGVGTGWDWLSLVHYGDYMNFIGIAFLASVTAVCYLRMLPISLRSKDPAFAAILVLEIVLLLLAAGGVLALGH